MQHKVHAAAGDLKTVANAARPFRISSCLVRKLRELKVSPADVLRHAGLPPGLLDQDRIRVNTDEFFALYKGLAEAGRIPELGLEIGFDPHIERYDPVSIAVISARTFRDALTRFARYKQLLCPEEVVLTELGDECRVRFRWLLVKEAEPSLLIDACFAFLVGIARRGTGEPIAPKRIEMRGVPSKSAIYRSYFGCPVKFNARQNTIVFNKVDLDRPFLTRNAELLEAIAPQLEQELREVAASDGIGGQVKAILKKLLAGHKPDIEDVARDMGTSSRTLQRRLTEAGVTFQQLMQEARRELARHYLLQSSLELTETAYLLGFADAHSFFRAFREWEGVPPGEWRERQTQSSALTESRQPEAYRAARQTAPN